MWEVAFKKKYDEALSVVSETISLLPLLISLSLSLSPPSPSHLFKVEMECCRRIVELSRCLLFCAYHYHCLQPHTKHKSIHNSTICTTVC